MLRFLTAGESHGPALTGIIEGIPAGLDIDSEYINRHLARRQWGHGRGRRMKIERDQVEILSGLRFGRTLGSPIALRIVNRDWANWDHVMTVERTERESKRITVPRPGHADYAGAVKYGHTDDMRNVLERASARETAMRVALGSVARRLLDEFGISIGSVVESIGAVEVGRRFSDEGQKVPDLSAVDASLVRCDDEAAAKAMIEAIDQAKEDGDTLGGVFAVWAEGVPMGLGSYVQWDRRLDGRLAQAMMSIPAVKGVEIGPAFDAARKRGSRVHDEFVVDEKGEGDRVLGRRSNRAGGLEGGITNGEVLVVRAALKPISTLLRPLRSVDLETGTEQAAHIERSDVCVVPAAAVVGESAVALVLAAALLEKFAGDTLDDVREAVERFRARAPTKW